MYIHNILLCIRIEMMLCKNCKIKVGRFYSETYNTVFCACLCFDTYKLTKLISLYEEQTNQLYSLSGKRGLKIYEEKMNITEKVPIDIYKLIFIHLETPKGFIELMKMRTVSLFFKDLVDQILMNIPYLDDKILNMINDKRIKIFILDARETTGCTPGRQQILALHSTQGQ